MDSIIKDKPTQPCLICKGTDYWYRHPGVLAGPGEWLCERCHPEPLCKQIIEEFVEQILPGKRGS